MHVRHPVVRTAHATDAHLKCAALKTMNTVDAPASGFPLPVPNPPHTQPTPAMIHDPEGMGPHHQASFFPLTGKPDKPSRPFCGWFRNSVSSPVSRRFFCAFPWLFRKPQGRHATKSPRHHRVEAKISYLRLGRCVWPLPALFSWYLPSRLHLAAEMKPRAYPVPRLVAGVRRKQPTDSCCGPEDRCTCTTTAPCRLHSQRCRHRRRQ